jgi:lysophospholipase L1-like esterase
MKGTMSVRAAIIAFFAAVLVAAVGFVVLHAPGRSLLLDAAALALASWAALLLIGMVGAPLSRMRGGRIMAAAAIILLVAVCVELSGWVLFHRMLTTASPSERRTYVLLTGDLAANDGGPRDHVPDGLQGTGLVSVYAPHPFMNYRINPAAAYMGERQFNAQYLIRRGEPIRPRDAVKWRALVLGGSTTFNEGVRDEADTWVHRLEERIRKANGDDYDVINGGVGGYSLVDNILHYTLLLRELRPDVVILFTGVNDVHPRLLGDILPDYSNLRVAWNGSPLEWIDRLKPFLWSNAARLYALMKVRGGAVGHIYSMVMKPYPPESVWEERLQHNGAQVYRSYLEFAIRLFRSEGHRIILLPQVWLPREGNEGDRLFAIGVNEHNSVGRAAAAEASIPFADSLLQDHLFERPDLFDACHFNAAGNEKMARLVYEFLTTNHLLR